MEIIVSVRHLHNIGNVLRRIGTTEMRIEQLNIPVSESSHCRIHVRRQDQIERMIFYYPKKKYIYILISQSFIDHAKIY